VRLEGIVQTTRVTRGVLASVADEDPHPSGL
jgi:hypothetical protein